MQTYAVFVSKDGTVMQSGPLQWCWGHGGCLTVAVSLAFAEPLCVSADCPLSIIFKDAGRFLQTVPFSSSLRMLALCQKCFIACR